MKILILSSPFCGAEHIAEAIADELKYGIILDPLTPRPTKLYLPPSENTMKDLDPNYTDNWVDHPSEPTKFNGIKMSPFNPTTIPDDTVGKHNVGWHDKFPNNMNEWDYCDAQRTLYDKTICIGTGDIDFAARRYTAYLNADSSPSGDNYLWEHWRLRHPHPYDHDTMWVESNKVKIRDSVNWLFDYADTNSILYVKAEDIYVPDNIDAWNSIIRSMAIGLNEHNGTSNYTSEFFNRTRMGDGGPKY